MKNKLLVLFAIFMIAGTGFAMARPTMDWITQGNGEFTGSIWVDKKIAMGVPIPTTAIDILTTTEDRPQLKLNSNARNGFLGMDVVSKGIPLGMLGGVTLTHTDQVLAGNIGLFAYDSAKGILLSLQKPTQTVKVNYADFDVLTIDPSNGYQLMHLEAPSNLNNPQLSMNNNDPNAASGISTWNEGKPIGTFMSYSRNSENETLKGKTVVMAHPQSNGVAIVADTYSGGIDFFTQGSRAQNLKMSITPTGDVKINSLAGEGNAFACLDSSGKLYRSAIACN